MNEKTQEEIEQEVLNLYATDKSVSEVADLMKIPRYLVEAILIETHDIRFR